MTTTILLIAAIYAVLKSAERDAAADGEGL